MTATSRPNYAPGDVVVLVGTMKGAFVISSDKKRTNWHIDGPHFPGEGVYAAAIDQRGGTKRLMFATRSWHFGSTVRLSDDMGGTWTGPERQAIRFPESSGMSLVQIWQIAPGGENEPGVVRAGVEPACLFESRDGGENWEPVEGLLNHEQRPRWQPGGGGLCLHTIVTDAKDPKRMGIAISTAGFYRTDDGGTTWTARNKGVRAEFLPDKYPELGQCVHKVVNHPSEPQNLYLQNHWGLYRSKDWGDTWTDMANGVPSDFGFAMAMHPHEPNTVFILPMQSDGFRVAPEAKLRVYRTKNGGDSWEALTNGLPQENAFETVLRDAMCTDSHDPAGVYFGTRGGKVYASNNSGDAWMEIADALPPVCCVKAAVVR